MPIDYKKYSPMWKIIRAKILSRAGNKCEMCGAPNGVKVVRPYYKNDVLYPWRPICQGGTIICDKDKVVKIVLTIHHINFDCTDDRDCNLIALCQKDHLRLDISTKTNKRKKKCNQH